MASLLSFSICLLLALTILRERFRLHGRLKAAVAVDWLAAVLVVLLPVIEMTALLVVAPGYLQSMAVESAGRWALCSAILAQVAINFVLKKILDFSVKGIVDLKV